MNYTDEIKPKVRPQTKPIKGRKKDMKQNNAGGYSFKIDRFDMLDRFLILGTEGGTYYVGQRQLTIQNAKNINKLIEKDGVAVVQRVLDIVNEGRASQMDPALFVLALCSAADALPTRNAAFAALPQVARIGTHLFQYVNFVNDLRGWGRALKRAVAGWYNDKTLADLEYQVLKYRNRHGFTHRDVLRLAHPNPAPGVFAGGVTTQEGRNALYKHITQGTTEGLSDRMLASIECRSTTNANRAIELINRYNLPRETINTELLNSRSVWLALLQKMPMTAMVRSLGKLGSLNLLQTFSEGEKIVVAALNNQEKLERSRIHPIALLNAWKVYGQGRGLKGSLHWTPNARIVQALERAFTNSFKYVEPSNKRFILGVDVSGSMGWGNIANLALTPREAAAVMAMVQVKREPMCEVYAFTGELTPLNIHAGMSYNDVLRITNDLSFGSTDCALPIEYALEKKIETDAFTIYTDNETYYGRRHPAEALKAYRQKMGVDAKMIVVGMTATRFSIADPEDSGMLDVVGFDTSTPNLITNFVKG